MKIEFIKYFYEKINNEKFYPFYIFALSVSVLFFELSGSIGSWDEAIYSEVAKEGILNNDWINFHHNDILWFEKPPLAVWLTMISYKIFGINEFATWFFPAVFGIIGILGTYYIAKKLFNSHIGFLSSLILLSIPHYVLMSRNNMMDIFLVSNSILSFLCLIKSEENKKYIIFSAIFLGLAFMSKNIVALLNLPVFFYFLYINNRLSALKDRNFYFSIILFFIIILPWHLIMILKYKWDFINEYIGYHLLKRYNENILGTYYSSDVFYYFRVLFERVGSWWFVFLSIIYILLKDIKDKINDRELKIIMFWLVFIFIFFTSSTTKLHHYILPFYVPFSILIAYGLYNAYYKKHILLLISTFIIFIDVNNAVMSKVSDFGESRLLFPVILYRLLSLPSLVIHGLVVFLICCIFYNYLSNKKYFALKISVLLIFIFNIILPFNPDRGPLAKEIGRQVKGKNIKKIYYYDYHTEQNLKNTLIYYAYPIKIKYLGSENADIFKENSSTYCLKSRLNYQKSKSLDYDFYPYEAENLY
jgi:4-amino-4-deoxy-L-arabinose transferase-like glycosyltransferase